MQYLLLIYEDESVFSSMTPTNREELLQGYFRFSAELKASGAMLGGEALQGIATAKTLRTRGGKTTVTDGPFAETKEQLGGFYFIDVPSYEDAERWAAKIPTVTTGCIEIRPVQSFG